MRSLAWLTLTVLPFVVSAALAGSGSADEGRVHVVKGMSPAFDSYVANPSSTQKAWLQEHFFRLVAYSPDFDSRTTWYRHAWVYLDAYAIYAHPSNGFPDLAAVHPEWILKDSNRERLYIPWGCNPMWHQCPQYAADFSNPSYQQWWIQFARRTLARGAYKGIWIDDVNLDFRVSDGDGHFRTPVDTNTGALMTEQNWRYYFAGFLENVRAHLPGIEIVHNSIWYAGGAARDLDACVEREIASADWINIEAGVNDEGLTGGNGVWSLRALLDYIDRLHAKGKRVVIDNLSSTNPQNRNARLYTLANYFLISSGGDAVEDPQMALTPSIWPAELSIDLGVARNTRTTWNGLLRRDFERGLVLVNPPRAPLTSVALPRKYVTPIGVEVSTVTLSPKEGIILHTRDIY